MTKNNRIDEVITGHVEDKIQNGDDARAELGRLDHEEPGLGRVLRGTERDIQNFLDFTGAPDQIKDNMKELVQVALARILASIRLGHAREWEAGSGLKTRDD